MSVLNEREIKLVFDNEDIYTSLITRNKLAKVIAAGI
jgi:hypothetical protein